MVEQIIPPDDALVEAYEAIAGYTNPICAKECEVAYSCCSKEHCEESIAFARNSHGIDLLLTNHPSLPLMGSDGCTAPPFLRPVCSLYTCQPGMDSDWALKYNLLYEEVCRAEAADRSRRKRNRDNR